MKYRHKKRGTEYNVVADAVLLTSGPLLDLEHMIVYRGADGKTWVRSAKEFYDGRYEQVKAADELGMINALRSEEGDCVNILSDNPDGPPNCAVECQGYWTEWCVRRFVGETLLEALSNAYLEYMQWKAAFAHGRDEALSAKPL